MFRKPTIVDLSHHQSVVQFGELRDAGVKAVILKATQGAYRVDPRFTEYVTRARSKGLLVGAYHFMTGEDATEQLDKFLETVKDYRPLLLCLDYEHNPNNGGQPTPEILTEMVKRMVKRLYRHPVLYGEDGVRLGPLLRSHAADPVLENCRRWIARYNAILKPKTPCDIWQYTNSAKIANMGPLDGNVLISQEYKSIETFWKRWQI